MSYKRIRVSSQHAHHPDTIHLSCLLNVEPCEALGAVVQFWLSVAHNFPDGNVGGLDDRTLDSLAGYWRKGRRSGRFAKYARQKLIDNDGRVLGWDNIVISRSGDQVLDPHTKERRKMGATLRSLVMERDGFKCQRCGAGREHGPLVVDHILPVIRGGKSDMGNLQTLCHECNAGKGDRMPTSHDLGGGVSGLDE